MHALRLVRADEPHEARENVDLRRTLERLTLGTHDRRRGFVLLPFESEALYAALARREFSHSQLKQVDEVIREIDPHVIDSKWDDHRLILFVDAMRQHIDRYEWVDLPLAQLHAAMRSQGPQARFRLWFSRAVLVAFLTVDFLDPNSETERLAG